jgi:hypothetical protein
VFHFQGAIALDGHQRRPQGGQQIQLLLDVLVRIREGLQQCQRLRQMADGFEIGIPPQGIVSRVLQIDHCPRGIPSSFKVHRQFRSYFTGARTIRRLQSCSDLAVPPHPPIDRHLFVQHCVIEVVDEAVARRRAIRPFGHPLGRTNCPRRANMSQ